MDQHDRVKYVTQALFALSQLPNDHPDIPVMCWVDAFHSALAQLYAANADFETYKDNTIKSLKHFKKHWDELSEMLQKQLQNRDKNNV